MDTHSKAQRSYNMSRIRAKDTKPEIEFRKFSWSKGIKGYRIHSKIRGKPDLYFGLKKIAVFIDGCFWHKCPVCFKRPKSNKKYWNQKIKNNVIRDLETDIFLEKKGIKVLRLWEHEIKNDINKCFNKLKKYLNKMFRTIDLFAGIGGIRLGFEKAGFTTVYANDFDEYCKATYDLNFGDVKLDVADITKVNAYELPDFDYLLGGFPCQAFSIAGYQHGFDDKHGRGNLFLDIARILKVKQPKGFLLENVKNLEAHDHGNTFKVIIATLERLGYHIKYKVLNSMDYGNVPQTRERIYIVGFKDKEIADNFRFPEKIVRTVKIEDLLDNNVDKKYYYNDKPLFEKLDGKVTKTDTVYQWRRIYVRENKSNVCPTLTANMGMGGHNVPIINDKKGIRKLTPQECLRFQGYPADYKLPSNIADSRLYKQIGNSVTTTVIEAIAKEMKKAILNKPKDVIKINHIFETNKSRMALAS